jgi:hypothetical protein
MELQGLGIQGFTAILPGYYRASRPVREIMGRFLNEGSGRFQSDLDLAFRACDEFPPVLLVIAF